LITEEDGIMQDYSAGHISTDEAKLLIESLQKTLVVQMYVFILGKAIGT